VDLRSGLERLFAYKLSFVISKYSDESVMLVKLARVEMTGKRFKSAARS
jgi:hypothetical protein